MDTWQQQAGQIPQNDRDVLNRQSFYRSLCVSAEFQQRTYPLAGNGTPREPTLDGVRDSVRASPVHALRLDHRRGESRRGDLLVA